jgi:hypothetical protein
MNLKNMTTTYKGNMSRQVRRAQLFSFHFQKIEGNQQYAYDISKRPLFKTWISRSERRKLARAFAAGAWKGERQP